MSVCQSLRCRIGPSVLNSDLGRVSAEGARLIAAGADFLHLDVMDGHFVPNLTFGAPLIRCMRQALPTEQFEAHMMVSRPEQWIESMADAGVDHYTFHIEPVNDVPTVCRKIREAGMKVGLALKPGTPVSAVEEYIPIADLVLVMTVEPGFGGQKFMQDQMEKVRWLRNEYPLLDIEVDGGVGLSTISSCAEAGANVIVSGTAVIGSSDPGSVIANLRNTVESSLHKCNV